MSAPREQIASPCVRNCCLDQADVCLGCFRSIEEIMRWGAAGASERQQILERCAARKAARRARYE